MKKHNIEEALFVAAFVPGFIVVTAVEAASNTKDAVKHAVANNPLRKMAEKKSIRNRAERMQNRKYTK